MHWRGTQAASRARYREKYDAAEAARYDALVGTLDAADEDAYLADLAEVFTFRSGMQVLDAGAGTGTLCAVLSRIPGLALTALEPAPAMLARLQAKPALEGIHTVEGFCDSEADRAHFAAGAFDVVVSRQLANCFYDPLAAFANWRHWLKPTGAVVLIDGLYDRGAWNGVWEEEVDVLPLAAIRTMATTPYLLESAGFHVSAVAPMQHANGRPSTRTTRYVVIAEKRAASSGGGP